LAIYAIADLHLAHDVNKPMDIFGAEWDAHATRIERAWRTIVQPEDTVLIPGDISWAMTIPEARADVDWIGRLPGTKIMIRGNHDYWWSGIGKVRALLPQRTFALQNDAIRIEDFAVCGSRGWLLPTHPKFGDHDRVIHSREVERLKLSLENARKLGGRLIAMLHYPPCTNLGEDTAYTDLMDAFSVQVCIYGHLHGPAHRFAFNGVKNGTTYQLVSSDYLKFTPTLLHIK